MLKRGKEIVYKGVDPGGSIGSYFFLYSILFLIVSFFCFSWFIFTGRTFIWESDGWTQHFKAYVYYSQYLRGILGNLIREHRLVIPNWDFHIGEGNDIINTFHFYVIGDPIAFLTVFVPIRLMPFFYSFSFVLRFYLSGFAFSLLCFGTGLRNRYGIVSAALSYSLCYWALLYGTRHPFFLNSLIYLPLMILGIERIMQKKSPALYTITVLFAAVTQFYFFYVIGMMTGLYVLIRIFIVNKRLKEKVVLILYIGGMTLTGAAMGGILVVPVLMFFLGDSRLSWSRQFFLFYPFSYYSQLPGTIVSNVYREGKLCLGFAISEVFAVAILFYKRKKDLFLKILLCLCFITVLLPAGGRFFNGMSYIANRWVWGFALLCAYVLAKEWDKLIDLTESEWQYLFVFSLVFYSICIMFEYSRDASVFSSISLFFIGLILLKREHFSFSKNIRQVLFCGITLISIVNVSFWTFAPATGNVAADYIEYKDVWDDWSDNETGAIKLYNDDEDARYSGISITTNANITSGVSNTQYYWSISNPYVNNYRDSLEMREAPYFMFEGYDSRTTPNTLAGVSLFSVETNENKGVPYGYTNIGTVNVGKDPQSTLDELKRELKTEELSETQGAFITAETEHDYTIYRNDYALPLAYCYDSYISRERWEDFNPVQKQEVELEAALLDIPQEELCEFAGEIDDFLVPYELEYCIDNTERIEGGFVTTSDDGEVIIRPNDVIENSEVYLEIKGLDFTGTPGYDLYFSDETVDPLNLYNKTNWDMLPEDKRVSLRKEKLYWNPAGSELSIPITASNGSKKTLEYYPSTTRLATGRKDYIVNLGFSEEPIYDITIEFPEKGIYTIEEINVYYIPMGERYVERVESLGQNTLQNISLETDSMSGEINLDKAELLCIAIPYSKGWKGYVDGKAEEVVCVNEHYLGIMVPDGQHSVLMQYHTPFLGLGCIVSVFGIISFVCICITWKRYNGRKGAESLK